MRILSLPGVLLALTGCYTIQPSINFPAEEHAVLNEQLYAAKECIEDVTGRPAATVRQLDVRLIRGTRLYPEGWAWYYNGRWVVSTCLHNTREHRYEVNLGVHPVTGRGVRPERARHAFGHVLRVADGDYTQNTVFSSCFAAWGRSAAVRTAVYRVGDGTGLTIHFIEPRIADRIFIVEINDI